MYPRFLKYIFCFSFFNYFFLLVEFLHFQVDPAEIAWKYMPNFLKGNLAVHSSLLIAGTFTFITPIFNKLMSALPNYIKISYFRCSLVLHSNFLLYKGTETCGDTIKVKVFKCLILLPGLLKERLLSQRIRRQKRLYQFQS